MRISRSHGSGGEETARLIEGVFLKHFKNPSGDGTRDAALLCGGDRIAFTTDSYVVTPLFFPGGDIGRLAVCGTVNDLLTTGATPRFLSAGFIIEEGCGFETLDAIAASMAEAAREAGVWIVTGDTKVIEGRGGVYINTAGIGLLEGARVDIGDVRPGDALLVTGTLGDHHACIQTQRMEIENGIASDAAPLGEIVGRLRAAVPLHGLRDITRGGLATVLAEIAGLCGLCMEIEETRLPMAPQVRAFCEMLGLDPLVMGNEGKLLAIVPGDAAQEALRIVRGARYGGNAAIIGRVCEGRGVILRTGVGGRRAVLPLSGEALPRIC